MEAVRQEGATGLKMRGFVLDPRVWLEHSEAQNLDYWVSLGSRLFQRCGLTVGPWSSNLSNCRLPGLSCPTRGGHTHRQKGAGLSSSRARRSSLAWLSLWARTISRLICPGISTKCFETSGSSD